MADPATPSRKGYATLRAGDAGGVMHLSREEVQAIRVGDLGMAQRIRDLLDANPTAEPADVLGEVRRIVEPMTGPAPVERVAPAPRGDLDYAALIAMWREGRTQKEIAEVLNTTPGTVGGTLSRLRSQGVDLPKREWRRD